MAFAAAAAAMESATLAASTASDGVVSGSGAFRPSISRSKKRSTGW